MNLPGTHVCSTQKRRGGSCGWEPKAKCKQFGDVFHKASQEIPWVEHPVTMVGSACILILAFPLPLFFPVILHSCFLGPHSLINTRTSAVFSDSAFRGIQGKTTHYKMILLSWKCFHRTKSRKRKTKGARNTNVLTEMQDHSLE